MLTIKEIKKTFSDECAKLRNLGYSNDDDVVLLVCDTV